MQPCVPPVDRTFIVTKDIVDSRQSWINAWEQCDAKYQRLIEWSQDEKPASPE